MIVLSDPIGLARWAIEPKYGTNKFSIDVVGRRWYDFVYGVVTFFRIKGLGMAEYVNWGVFFAGFIVGGMCVYSVCELVFPVKNRNE